MLTEELLFMAEQQLTGFQQREYSDDVTDLIESMGLRQEEWEHIKNNIDDYPSFKILSDDDKQRIEDLFNHD